MVVYESKHRIIKFLEELDKLVAANKYLPETEGEEKETKKLNLTSVVVCRELSKMHETVYRGDLPKIIEKIKGNKDDQRGEFVVIVG